MLSGLTVLIAEDEQQLREILALSLSPLNCSVLQACDGEAALEIVAERQGAIDVLVTDMRMPRLGGRELVESMRISCPDVGIVCMTGYSDEAEFLSDFRRRGGTVLEKPFPIEDLAETLHELSKKRRR